MKTPNTHLLSALAAILSITSLGAQTWTGGTDSLWTQSNNWNPAGVPGGNATLVFDSVANQTVNLAGATRTVTLATFNSGDSYILNNGTLDFTAAGSGFPGNTVLQQNGTGNIVFNSNVSFSGISSGGNRVRISGVAGSGEIEFAGQISRDNSANLLISDATVRLTGNTTKNLAAGTITIGAGVAGPGSKLIVNMGNQTAQNGSLGSGIIQLAGGTLEFAGLGATINNVILVSSGSPNDTIKSAGALTLNGNVATSGSRTLTLDAGANSITIGGNVTANEIDAATSVFTLETLSNTTVNGAVQNNGARILALTKTGAATLTLNGSNTHTGKTTVSAGTLLLNGTHIESSAVTGQGYGTSGNGHYLVSNGTTFGGTGRISGYNNEASSNLMYVASNATLAPGGGDIGTFTLDGKNITGSNARVLKMISGAMFAFDLNGNISDEMHFWNYKTGALLLDNNAINLTLDDAVANGDYTATLFRFFGDDGMTLTDSTILSGLTLGTLDARITNAVLHYNGETISLGYTVVPEPHTALLFLLGAGALLFRLRRRGLQSQA